MGLFLFTALALLGFSERGASFDIVSPRNIMLAQQQGPNMCVIEEVPGTSYQLWTECKYWADRTICGRKATIRYDCCEGYFRINSDHGCTGVEPLSDVIETARRSGANIFADFLERSGVAEDIRRARPGIAFTIFAPSDAVLGSPSMSSFASSSAFDSVVLYHIVEGRHPTKKWQADQLIPTRLNAASVRVNKFSSKIQTVNCAMVIRKDREASNGVVHIIDALLDPSRTYPKPLIDVVQEDGRFRQLSELLDRSLFIQQLQSPAVSYSLLAPNDEAFQKIPMPLRQRLFTNIAATEALLANLIITQPICRVAVTTAHRLTSRGGNHLDIDCNGVGDTRVQGNRLAETLFASNGIIYMLNDVPIPDSALSVLQLLERMRLFTFLDLVRTAGLETFFNDEAVQLTVFAPSEQAIAGIPQVELQHLRSDLGAARHFVLQHVARGIYTTDNLTDNEVVRSVASNAPLRFQVYRRGLGVETAMIEDQRDRRALNGIVHVVDGVLRPADRTLRDQLRQDGNFSMFLQALDTMQADDPASVHLGHGVSGYSILAPTDAAFHRLNYETRNNLFSDRRMLRQVMQHHFLNKMMSTKSLKEDLKYDVPSQAGMVRLERRGDIVTVDDATAVRYDMTNLDGVVHVINKVLWSENVTWGMASTTYPPPPLMSGYGG